MSNSCISVDLEDSSFSPSCLYQNSTESSARQGPLRLIAQFAREPVSGNLKAATARRLALRETINTNLEKVRALADSVLLEFGRSREQDLALRNRTRRAQPQIRVLFIMQIAEWK